LLTVIGLAGYLGVRVASIVVTGGAGFIGSHIVDRLVASGASVAVVDDLSSGRAANLEAAMDRAQVPLYRMSVIDAAIDDVLARERPRVVMHLAAQIDVRRSVADPVGDAMTNVVGTVRLLDAAARHGVQKVVFATSGGCIYGQPPLRDLPVAEDYPGHAHSPYGASKRCAEEYLHTYAALYGLRWTSLALGNVFGPRQDPAGEAGVVGIFAERMLRGDAVHVYGDGEQTRDFVYVADVADAFLAAADAGDDMRLNIGTGQRTSVNELFGHLAAITGYPREPEYLPAREGELDHSAVDPLLASATLGWRPHTSLRDALTETVASIASPSERMA